MASALCRAPDPADPSYEGCVLSEGHGLVVPHLWAGVPCRHFRRTTGDDGRERCAMCGQRFGGTDERFLRGADAPR